MTWQVKKGFPEVTSKLSYSFRIGVRQQHWGQRKRKGRDGRVAPQGTGREEDCSTGEQKLQKSSDKSMECLRNRWQWREGITMSGT